MKSYWQAWWRGIGVIGLFLAISIVVGGIGLLVDVLRERVRLAVGAPLLILVVPPPIYWTFRWVSPEIAEARGGGMRGSIARPEMQA